MAGFVTMSSQFSLDGKYFAQIANDGKLKIWNTLSNSFLQEFTPNFHLTSTCTCLHFVHLQAGSKLGSPRKKRRKESQSEGDVRIALGTSSGLLLIYSLTKADLEFTIDSASSLTINCLSSNHDDFVYCGADNHIIVFDLRKRNISSKWSTGNDKISAILTIADNRLLTASRNIKLWDLESKEVVKTFTGHSSQVTLLHHISTLIRKTDSYIISGSVGDRVLNCWNLNENVDGKNAIASFLMEETIQNFSVFVSPDGTTHMAATVKNGVVHVYQHTLNGAKYGKPVKPKTTIQIVCDAQEKTVRPLCITSAAYRDVTTLCIAYGSALVQIFENITISSSKKLQCLLRQDPHHVATTKEGSITKLRAPVVGDDVHYLTTQPSNLLTNKRKNEGQQEVPMEKRLENLALNELDSSSKVPRANNMAQLLVQGLHSKDKNILKTVLLKKNELLIQNTIKRLPMPVIIPLFDELTKYIQGKTLSRQIGLLWIKNLVLIHSALLLSNPDLPQLFGEALASIEASLALQSSRNKLMGRLELLISQVSHVTMKESAEEVDPMLVFNDRESEDSDDNVMKFEVHSDSDNEWEEEESSGGENNQNGKLSDDSDDESMSE